MIALIVRAFIVRYEYYTIYFRYKNVTQSALFLKYINVTLCVRLFEYKNVKHIWAMNRQKNDVPAEIFIQGLENPLARGRESLVNIQLGAQKASRDSAILLI